jgi:hypothetical protein
MKVLGRMKAILTSPLAGVLILTIFGCASERTTNDHGLNLMSSSAYESTIDQWTDYVETYNGINNTVTVQATLINSEVAAAQTDQSARTYQWDQAKYDSEKKDLAERLSKETDVFVSFYSPERKWDDLSKSKTLWKMYLDVNGQRYEGKAIKSKLLPRELQSLYHYHSSFSTPYMLSFPVSTKSVDGKPARLVLTGAVDAVTLDFPPK